MHGAQEDEVENNEYEVNLGFFITLESRLSLSVSDLIRITMQLSRNPEIPPQIWTLCNDNVEAAQE